MMKYRRLACWMSAAVLCAAGAVGCARERLEEPGLDPAAEFAVAPQEYRDAMLSFAGDERSGPAKNILVLSGGGANGAWGAGFLCGWGERDDRPKFDVVTGVSTGALICTAALLGDDDTLREAYTATDADDVHRRRSLLSLPCGNSLNDTTPLKELIEEYVPNKTIDRVAAASSQKAYVATVDLDTGRLVIWDLSRIARAGEYDLYRQVVLASAAAPVLYPPVEIGPGLHADGGVRANLFFEDYLVPSIANAGERTFALYERDERRAARTTGPATAATTMPTTAQLRRRAPSAGKVYAINNGAIGVPPQTTRNRLLPIATRSASCLLDQNGLDSIRKARWAAREAGYDFALSYIPAEVTATDSFAFDMYGMQRLFADAVDWGREARWAPAGNVDHHASRLSMPPRGEGLQ